MKYDRRSLGRLILEEPDELIKLVCGQLVRDLHAAHTSLGHLFPTTFAETVYEDFPKSTQGNVGWFKLFQKYVDTVYLEERTPLLPQAGSLVISDIYMKTGTKRDVG